MVVLDFTWVDCFWLINGRQFRFHSSLFFVFPVLFFPHFLSSFFLSGLLIDFNSSHCHSHVIQSATYNYSIVLDWNQAYSLQIQYYGSKTAGSISFRFTKKQKQKTEQQNWISKMNFPAKKTKKTKNLIIDFWFLIVNVNISDGQLLLSVPPPSQWFHPVLSSVQNQSSAMPQTVPAILITLALSVINTSLSVNLESAKMKELVFNHLIQMNAFVLLDSLEHFVNRVWSYFILLSLFPFSFSFPLPLPLLSFQFCFNSKLATTIPTCLTGLISGQGLEIGYYNIVRFPFLFSPFLFFFLPQNRLSFFF